MLFTVSSKDARSLSSEVRWLTDSSWQQDKKLVSCRQDWHQTSSQVVVTVYAKTPLPELSSVKANRTVVSVETN